MREAILNKYAKFSEEELLQMEQEKIKKYKDEELVRRVTPEEVKQLLAQFQRS